MNTCLAKTAAACLVIALLASCGDNRSHGPVQTQTRELTGFSAIDMEGAARLEISIGSPHSVELEAPVDVLERLETEVRGETLVIESRPKDWFRNGGRARLTIKISTPQLTALRLGGGNDVRLQGYAGGESSIRVEGAANIEARGELDSLNVRMSGAGNADLSRLVASNARVTVDGVGSVVVHATETLDATMNGVGAIHYTGSPRDVSTRMNGLGRIGKIDPKEAPASDEEVEIDPEKLQPEYEDEKQQQAVGAEMVI